MIAADAMTDAVLARDCLECEAGDVEYESDVRIGDSLTPAVAVWTWDAGGVCLLSVICGELVLLADDLSDAMRAHVCLQVARSLPEDL